MGEEEEMDRWMDKHTGEIKWKRGRTSKHLKARKAQRGLQYCSGVCFARLSRTLANFSSIHEWMNG